MDRSPSPAPSTSDPPYLQLVRLTSPTLIRVSSLDSSLISIYPCPTQWRLTAGCSTWCDTTIWTPCPGKQAHAPSPHILTSTFAPTHKYHTPVPSRAGLPPMALQMTQTHPVILMPLQQQQEQGQGKGQVGKVHGALT